MYTSEDIKIAGHSYQTKDGKYQTKTTSSSWYLDGDGKKVEFNKGYAYWYDESGSRMGSTSYDYLFFNGEEGIDSAVKVLNEVISL